MTSAGRLVWLLCLAVVATVEPAQAQRRVVSGVVTTVAGDPVEAATVSLFVGDRVIRRTAVAASVARLSADELRHGSRSPPRRQRTPDSPG